MKLSFRDFIPVVTKKGMMSTEYESFDRTVERAASWLQSESIELINVETVVLPEPTPAKQDIYVSGENSSSRFQIVRVWYKK